MNMIIQITTAIALILSIIVPFGYFFLGEKNKKTYFSINRLPSDREESINLVNDMRICPKCHHKLKYNYVRYHHIGNAKCEFCGYASPVGDYKAELDFDKNVMAVAH